MLKIVTLSKESRRILLHIYALHTDVERKEVAGNFVQKMADSSYNHSTRSGVNRSGCTKFSKQVLEQLTGG